MRAAVALPASRSPGRAFIGALLLASACAADPPIAAPSLPADAQAAADALVAVDAAAAVEVVDAVDVPDSVDAPAPPDAIAVVDVALLDAAVAAVDVAPDLVALLDAVDAAVDVAPDFVAPVDVLDAQDAAGKDAGSDAVDAGFDSGIAPAGCKVDSDCGLISTVCAFKWLCGVDPATKIGTCIAQAPAANGTPCDDGSPCTTADVCIFGTCVGHLKDCEDGNPCTVDKCTAANGVCQHTAALGPVVCSDGDRCTVGDSCVKGVCTAGQANICDCKIDTDCAVQDSADLCVAKHVCAGNQCVLGTPPAPCPQSPTPCQVNACDPASGQCALSAVGDGSPCSDGDVCTYPDLCQGGACKAPALQCNDGNPCTDDSCVSGSSLASGAGCQFTFNTAPCDDGDACTGSGSCSAGVCSKGAWNPTLCGCAVDADCVSLNSQCGGVYHCTASQCVVDPTTVVLCDPVANNACQSFVCVEAIGSCAFNFAAPGAPCDDGNVCTTGDHCEGSGKCVKTASFKCVDGDPCTNDYCLPAFGCYHPFNSALCDDGDACTSSDKCAFGKCVGSPYTDASKITLMCQCQTAADCAKLDANKCQPAHGCSLAHVCTFGGSKPADPCASEAKTPCHIYGCNPVTGTCSVSNTVDGLACSDGDLCTQDDACQGGNCLGVLNLCDDGNSCTIDACWGLTTDPFTPPGTCVFAPLSAQPCDDGSACTTGDTCSGGVCLPGAVSSCDDGDACTLDSCGVGGCSHSPGGCAPPGMVLIPAGKFWMGCNSVKDANCNPDDEQPQHKVTLSAYYIDLTETTVGQYKACVDAGVCSVPGPSFSGLATWPNLKDHPVNNVSWGQAGQYCQWRGLGFDLPTEAQWEMAARGSCEMNGSTADDPTCAAAMRTYPWGETLATCSYAVYMSDGIDGCGTGALWAVGSMPTGDSPYGLHDMAGNVWEWTGDWYSSSYYASSPATDPYDSAGATDRVGRGGSLFNVPYYLRASFRYAAPPSTAYDSLGFRCIRAYP